MNEPTSHYTPSPQVPPELMSRLQAIVEVLAGMKTVSQAARDVSLSRNHFQTILHRGLYAMIETLTPREPGRHPKPEAMSELERRIKKLEQENSRLKKRVEATDELITVAGQLLHGQRQPGQRSRRVRKKGTTSGSSADEEPEGARQNILAAVDHMRHLGLTNHRAAWLAGVDASTVRRWRREGNKCAHRTRASLAPAVINQAQATVRDLHGLIGAAALSRAIPDLSRRAAGRLKAQILTAMERERQASLVRLTVSAPGLIRGMDAMHLKTDQGVRYALICADAAVPYRTSFSTAEHCDATFVAGTIENDIAWNGAPLILRADRARAHDSPEVRAVLESHRVLMLHGPPRYPRFYGQLERQNREHRAWLEALMQPLGNSMQQLLGQMIHCLNTLWPRRALGWKTAEEAWNARKPILVDRDAFQKEVHDRARHIERSFDPRGRPADMVERLAIEQTFVNMGYLHRQVGGWC